MTPPGLDRDLVERYRLLLDLDRELRPLDDPDEVVRHVAHRLGGLLGCDRCAWAEVEDDGDHVTVTGDSSPGLPHPTGRFAVSGFGAPALRAVRAGLAWVVADAEDDPRLAPEDVRAHRATGIRALLFAPVVDAGRFVAVMAAHQAAPRQWTPAQVEIVTAVVHRCWESLQRVRALRALRASEERYRALVEQAVEGIWMFDGDGVLAEANPAGCAMLGYAPGTMPRLPASAFVRPADRPRLTAMLDRLQRDRPVTQVWDLRRADGRYVPIEVSIRPTAEGRVQTIGRDVSERVRRDAEREDVLRREHEIAEALQRSLLPGTLPRIPRLAAAGRYLPAAAHAQAGGDWYEVVALDEARVALVVGDVVGQGPGAAAVMGQLRSALSALLLGGRSPAAALERLDRFARRTAGARGSTCACLVLDLDTGRLCWALAGHLPVLVTGPDGTRFLDGGAGSVLGLDAGATPAGGLARRPPYTEAATTIEPGTTVVLYTDGLVERRGEVVDEGLDRLAAACRAHRRADPDALASAVLGEVFDDPRGGLGDDVALVAVRLLPPPLELRLPARPESLGPLRWAVQGWAGATALPDALVEDLLLAVGEAAANAVEHAGPTPDAGFTCRLAADRGAVAVEVRDGGRWRPPPADPGFRGHGLRLIGAIADDLAVDGGDGGTAVRFVLR